MVLNYFCWNSYFFFKEIHNDSSISFKDIIVQVNTVLVCFLFSENITQINGIIKAICQLVQYTLTPGWAPICKKSFSSL